MTLIEFLRDWDNKNPDAIFAAAEHRFECKCAACMTFLVVTGLEAGEEPENENGNGPPVLDPEWVQLRGEDCDPVLGPTPAQVDRTMAIAGRTL